MYLYIEMTHAHTRFVEMLSLLRGAVVVWRTNAVLPNVSTALFSVPFLCDAQPSYWGYMCEVMLGRNNMY